MLNKLTVKARLIFVIGFLSLLLVVMGLMGLRGMDHASQRLATVYEDRLIPSHQIADIEALMQQNIIQLQLAGMHDPRLDEHVLHDHPIQLHTDRVRANLRSAQDIWQRYLQTYLTPEEARLASELERLNQHFIEQGLIPAIEDFEAGRYMAANMHMVRVVNPAFTEAFQAATELLDLQQRVAEQEYRAAIAEYQATRNLAIIMIVVGILLASLVGWLLIRAIARPLERAVVYFDQIAQGNLNNRIQIDNDDEIGRVLKALEAMQTRLRELVTEIKGSVEAITTAAQEIATGNTDLSQRTEEQASSLEETASSLEELTSTVRQNADNARQANQLSASASQVATAGGDKVRLAVSEMDELKASAEKMSHIIAVIDGIAFQTNILALNAAVEAARAGEQGRGFAVVAGEVRSLAQRSASAAKEIQELIRIDGEIVDRGSRFVKDAGETMEEIVTSVQRVTDIMGEISAASDEQSQGIEQVNQAVMQMDGVTQQNAALVEEAAAAAESLEEQASSLAAAVSIFKVQDVQHTAPAARNPAVPASTPKMRSVAPSRTQRPAAHPAQSRTATLPQPKKAPVPAPQRHQNDEWEEF